MSDTPLSAFTFAGHAIISCDGMLADGDGLMPDCLFVPEDQALFQQALSDSDVVVLGSKGHKRHPNRGRRRLVLTSQVESFEPDPQDALSVFWNPASCDLHSALNKIGFSKGTIAVTGGRMVFDYFGPHLTEFWLAEVHTALIPEGTPCFSDGHARAMLARFGLQPVEMRTLNLKGPVTTTLWKRG